MPVKAAGLTQSSSEKLFKNSIHYPMTIYRKQPLSHRVNIFTLVEEYFGIFVLNGTC